MILVIITAKRHNEDNTVDKAFYLGDGQVANYEILLTILCNIVVIYRQKCSSSVFLFEFFGIY